MISLELAVYLLQRRLDATTYEVINRVRRIPADVHTDTVVSTIWASVAMLSCGIAGDEGGTYTKRLIQLLGG